MAGGSGELDDAPAQGRADAYPRLRDAVQARHMLKDVRLCLEAAQAAGPPSRQPRRPATSSRGMARGHADDDFAALLESLEIAGRRIGES